jgi:hypothetical protein
MMGGTSSLHSAVSERVLVWSAERQAFVARDETEPGRKSASFIKGPLPLGWMQRASCLPGKTLQVALTLWYLAGLKKTQSVRLASKQLAGMGVSRDAKYDALDRLASAGLVSVQQQSGKAPMVTLLTSKI